MYARDVLSRPVVSVRPHTPLSEAISLLTEHGFAALPVVDDDEHVIGLLSESDALTALTRQQTGTVAAAMTTPVEVIEPGAEVTHIALRMLTGRLHSLPVVEAGVLVGIVARRDLLRALLDDDATIEAKVRALLDDYVGSRRELSIVVSDGHAVVRGGFADPVEQRTVAALARSVEGIRDIRVVPDTAHGRHTPHEAPEHARRSIEETLG
jgi:CBS domain-containing protein